ncbi:MAG TPA: histidine kinase [Nonomuraea sp.]|nr:histidine kinase [Nonomuraea sp.]
MDGARLRPADAVAVLVAAGLTLTIDDAGPVLPLFLAASFSLMWMRRAPLTVAWIAAGTAVALPALSVFAPFAAPPVGGVLVWPPAGAFAAYGAMAFPAGRRHGVLRWLPVVTLALGVLLLAQWPAAVPLALRTEAVIALAVLYGLYAETRTRLARALDERAERVERERLAGEMHDVVTHRVSRMVLQAGALSVASPDERTRLAAEELRSTACEALDELRHMVALLRRGTGEGFDLGLPLPDLRSLISESACGGVPVELTVTGTPAPVSGAAGRAAYRVVQVALADARDRAPGADAQVEVRYLPGVVRITVRVPRPGAPAEDSADLNDLSQWVELAGGTLKAAPTETGTFEVEATLPTSPP